MDYYIFSFFFVLFVCLFEKMPNYKAVLSYDEAEGVASLKIQDGACIGLKFSCGSCREEGKKFVVLDPSAECEVDGGGIRHLAYKCSFCDSLITANLLSVGKYVFASSNEDEDNEVEEGGSLFTIDVRRGEPIAMKMDDQWVATSTKGIEFQADLSQDWCEYDEKNGESLSLLGVCISFVKTK